MNSTRSGPSANASSFTVVGSVAVVGDVCIPRKQEGRHYVVPLHADIQVRTRRVGSDCLTPVLSYKIANGVTEAEGNGGWVLREAISTGLRHQERRRVHPVHAEGWQISLGVPGQKVLSMFTQEEMQHWFRSFWADIKGTSTRSGHPAPFPVELAERLIRMFSFAGDSVLDPFAGVGSTNVAAIQSGRNSIGNELEKTYFDLAWKKVRKAASAQAVRRDPGGRVAQSEHVASLRSRAE